MSGRRVNAGATSPRRIDGNKTDARRAIENGGGGAVVDPHGDFIQHLMETMSESRVADCVQFSPKHFPVSLEILSAANEHEIDLLSDDLIRMFCRTSESWGDKMQAILQMAFQTLLRVRSRLQRYVALDIHVEKYSEETGFTIDLTKPIIEDLAQFALDNPSSLKAEFGWLVTKKAKRGYDFGYVLGQKDKNFSLLLELIQIYQNKIEEEEVNLGLLGGYFRALREADENIWEKVLDILSERKQTKILIPGLSQMSGLTEKGAVRIANLFEENEIAFWQLNRFQYGLQIQNISENTLKRWLIFLLGQDSAYAVSIALNYLYQYYVRESSSDALKLKLPENLAFKILTHKSLFDAAQQENFDQMGSHYWQLIAARYMNLYKDKSLKFAKVLLKNFGEDGSLSRGLDEAPISVLDEVAREFPLEVWRIASSYIRFPMDKKTMRIKFWLENGALQFGDIGSGNHKFVPLDELWKWIDKDIEKRAWFTAWFVPSIIRKLGNYSPIARELLIRYGDREDVRNNLYANFGSTGIITGNMSNYYQNRLEEFIEIKAQEDHPNVVRWLDEHIQGLQYCLEQSRISEEREF